ncbi:MAG TPA: hypothetical protein VEJ67_01510 [Candidatus Cybelea sp.]|nr:hypothetical protein [Candidatus Cybelea sp.]
MAGSLKYAALLVAFAVPCSAAFANQTAAVRCTANEDSVWVYDSPTSFNVEEKLKCDATVSLIARQDSYLVVETADGTQGYIPVENISLTALTAPQAARPQAPTTPAVAVASVRAPGQPAPVASAAARPEVISSNSASAAAPALKRATVEASPARSLPANAVPAALPDRRALASSVREPSVTAAISNVSTARRPAPAASNDEESDDPSWVAATAPRYDSDDPACKLFFSSYGLSPGQFQWIVENRKKRFPSVCPAASPAMVDYVIIFTHDVSFYNYTMPTPVHDDGEFSDFNPIARYDENVPRSEIDRSKREYVWVFHVQRGSYDPAAFSPHRRFQFSKVESRYSQTIEDALGFIQTHPVNR